MGRAAVPLVLLFRGRGGKHSGHCAGWAGAPFLRGPLLFEKAGRAGFPLRFPQPHFGCVDERLAWMELPWASAPFGKALPHAFAHWSPALLKACWIAPASAGPGSAVWGGPLLGALLLFGAAALPERPAFPQMGGMEAPMRTGPLLRERRISPRLPSVHAPFLGFFVLFKLYFIVS